MFLDHIKNLWNGKVPLVITFWIYEILLGTIVSIFTIERYQTINDSISLIAYFIYFIYTILIIKALWSSATNYEGPKVWEILVKFHVIFNFIWIITIFPLKIYDHTIIEDLITFLGVEQ